MLLGWLSQMAMGITDGKLHKLAEGIATDCHDAVWNRTRDEVGGMSLNEARGYIRVRAFLLIQQEAQQVLEETRLPARCHAKLVDLATQRVIRNVLDQARAQRVVRLRRAA